MKTILSTEFFKHYQVNFRAKYPEEDFIGRGGYGSVYKGYFIKGNQEVAIKRSETNKGLLDEVQKASQVPMHPNIARYLDGFRVDSGTDDYDVAILQYYPKGNLNDLVENEKLSENQIDGLLKGILEGLKFLHNGFIDAQGKKVKIIHRDLKPQNVLIAEYRGIFTPLLTDFGVSKLVNEKDELSGGKLENSSDGGTTSFKAPEQIKNSIVKSNLDLWAFGVLVYRILNKKNPFTSDSSPDSDSFRLEVMNKITKGDLEEIFNQVKNQPAKYQQLIKRCLVRDINERVQTADELIDIIDGIEEQIEIAIIDFKSGKETGKLDQLNKAKEQFKNLFDQRPTNKKIQNGIKECDIAIVKQKEVLAKQQIIDSRQEEKTDDNSKTPIDSKVDSFESAKKEKIDLGTKRYTIPNKEIPNHSEVEKQPTSFWERITNYKKEAAIGIGVLFIVGFFGNILFNNNKTDSQNINESNASVIAEAMIDKPLVRVNSDSLYNVWAAKISDGTPKDSVFKYIKEAVDIDNTLKPKAFILFNDKANTPNLPSSVVNKYKKLAQEFK